MLHALILTACAFLLYWPARNGPFLYDDISIANHKLIQRGLLTGWGWRSFRLLTLVSYAANVRVFGRGLKRNELHKARFHEVNVAIHTGASLALWWAASWLLTPSQAFLVALIFAVHPACSQGVAYISGRASALAGMFGFLGVGAMLAGHPLVSIAAVILAALAKEDAITLFAVIAAAGLYAGISGWWLPLVTLVGALIWQYRTIQAQCRLSDSGMTDAGFPGMLPFPVYQQTAFTENLLRFLQWSAGFKFCVDPEIQPASQRSLRFWMALGLAIILAGLSVRYPLVALLAFWAACPLAPYVLIRIPDPVMEQRAYFSVGASAIALGLGLSLTSPLAIGLTLVWFAANAASRAWYWRSAYALWMQCLIDGGRQDRALINLGVERIGVKDYPAARRFFNDALAGNPDLAIARANLAMIDKMEGHPENAIPVLQETVRRAPRFFQGWFALGQAFEQYGKFIEARAAYTTAKALKGWAPIHNRLGILAARNGDMDCATEEFKQAMALDRLQLDYQHNYASALLVSGKQEDAVTAFKKMPTHYPLTPEMLIVRQT